MGEVDWKSVLLWRGDAHKTLQRVAASLSESEAKRVLQLVAHHLTTQLDRDCQEQTLYRFRRRQVDDQRYGSDLLQERLVADMHKNHPVWKKHNLCTATAWQKACNRIYDALGPEIDAHIANCWQTDPNDAPQNDAKEVPFYAQVAIVKRLIDQLRDPYRDEKPEDLRRNLKILNRAAIQNTVDALIALEKS